MKNRLSWTSRKYYTNQIAFVLTLVVVSILTACTHTTPSQYYLLSPVKDTTQSSAEDVKNLHVIGIGPIKFPKYLNRSPIVRFSSENEVVVDEFNRWAEPLEQNFSRVLRTNLTRLVPSSYALEYPWRRSMNVRYQVMLEVHQFETHPDGNVNLSAHWVILNLAKKKKVEVVRKFNYSKKISEVSYANMVAEQSKALETLSQDIAKEIQKLL